MLNNHPRIDGSFNILLGIFLLIAAYGLILLFESTYSSLASQCAPGLVCTPTPLNPAEIAPIYLFLGFGIFLGVYSLKLILSGVLSIIRPAAKIKSEQPAPVLESQQESEVAETPKPSPPPASEPASPLLSSAIERCSYCGAELPSGATYCPNCFQKRRIDPAERRLLKP